MKTDSTRFAILGLLALEPMSGYDIKATVDGELVRLQGPLKVESVPGALRVLAPA